jgi:cation transport ATPase
MTTVQEKMHDLGNNLAHTTENIKEAFETTKETIKDVAKQTKRYYRSTLFACGSLFLLNGLLLYFGTLSGGGRIDLARFYGFREGKNEHMQRSIGLMCFLLAVINFIPLVFKFEERTEVVTMRIATVINIFTMIHYSLETLFFKGIRLEVVFCMGMFLIMNMFWTFKEMFQAKRSNIVVVKDVNAPGANRVYSAKKTI